LCPAVATARHEHPAVTEAHIVGHTHKAGQAQLLALAVSSAPVVLCPAVVATDAVRARAWAAFGGRTVEEVEGPAAIAVAPALEHSVASHSSAPARTEHCAVSEAHILGHTHKTGQAQPSAPAVCSAPVALCPAVVATDSARACAWAAFGGRTVEEVVGPAATAVAPALEPIGASHRSAPARAAHSSVSEAHILGHTHKACQAQPVASACEVEGDGFSEVTPASSLSNHCSEVGPPMVASTVRSTVAPSPLAVSAHDLEFWGGIPTCTSRCGGLVRLDPTVDDTTA
jgi:hypothetical protein